MNMNMTLNFTDILTCRLRSGLLLAMALTFLLSPTAFPAGETTQFSVPAKDGTVSGEKMLFAMDGMPQQEGRKVSALQAPGRTRLPFLKVMSRFIITFMI